MCFTDCRDEFSNTLKLFAGQSKQKIPEKVADTYGVRMWGGKSKSSEMLGFSYFSKDSYCTCMYGPLRDLFIFWLVKF